MISKVLYEHQLTHYTNLKAFHAVWIFYEVAQTIFLLALRSTTRFGPHGIILSVCLYT
jgi:hypothetical protein